MKNAYETAIQMHFIECRCSDIRCCMQYEKAVNAYLASPCLCNLQNSTLLC